MSNQEKDLRLWNKDGGSIIPFATRSQKLAMNLMETVGVKDNIIRAFNEGKVLRTNCLNPISISQENLTEKDEGIIADLDKNGLLVYHVLLSYFMEGKQTQIQCEYEVSTYEKVIATKSYLCVPKDIFTEAKVFDADITNESNRESVIKEYIKHDIFMANQDYLYVYVVGDNGSADLYNIGVHVLNRDLIRIS